jgi:hypothetical protein
MTDIHISHKINSLLIKSISYIRVYVKLKNAFIEKTQHIKFSFRLTTNGSFDNLSLWQFPIQKCADYAVKWLKPMT